MKQVEEVRAISWRMCVELRFVSATGRAIDAREITEWGSATEVPEFERADGLRREAFRVAVGALTDVEESIVNGTSPYRSLVAEFDRDAKVFGSRFGRELDGSPAEEWSLDRLDVQRVAMERHLVLHYACTEQDPSAERLSRLDALAGRAYHVDQTDELIRDDRRLGQQVMSYRARERVARDGWVIERLEGAVADPVGVVEGERLARACVQGLDEAARQTPSGVLGALAEWRVVETTRAQLAAAHRGRQALLRAAPAPTATLVGESAAPGSIRAR